MNNNENRNDGLNTISLGSIDSGNNLNVPISDIPPVAPIEPVETLDDTPMMGPVESLNQTPMNEIPSVNQVPLVEPVAPISYDIPQTIDNFSTTPIFNDIGTVPPINNGPIVETIVNDPAPKKKKNGTNKLIFILVIVLAIAAVGVAVYIFLHMTNKSKVQIKNINLEIGSVVSSDINDYATFNGIDSSTCTLDTTGIKDTNVLNAEYVYYVTCNNATYKGNVKIVDTVKPEVVLKDVTVAVNATVSADLFIESCTDSTNCTYSFKDETKVNEYLKIPESYHVTIIVKDEAGNETEVVGTLIVSNTIVSVYLICTKDVNGYTETNKFGLVEGSFNKVATRTYTFKFNSEADYNTFKTENSNNSEVTYLNITGSPKFNDSELSLNLTKVLTYEDLNKEAGFSVPLSYGELKDFYQNKNYTCNLYL